jgi:hypothetical protein
MTDVVKKAITDSWFSTRTTAVFCIAVAVVMFSVGFLAGGRYFGEKMAKWREVRTENKALVTTLEEREQHIVNLEMADNVNRLAEEKLRQQLTELQTEQVKLEGELYLYKGLAEDEEAKVGLNLESLTIRPGEAPDRFRYDMVVRRTEVLSKTVDVALSLKIEGQLHGIPFSVAYREADPEVKDDRVSVSFKYFKLLQGEFVLPEHFVPERVEVSLYESGRADSLVIKEIPWKVISY